MTPYNCRTSSDRPDPVLTRKGLAASRPALDVWIGVFAVATVAALFGFGIVSGARVLAGEVFGAFALSAAVALFLRARRPPDSLVSNFPVEVRIVPRYALETIIVVLLLLWLLGAFLVPVGGDLIHLLLLVVLVVVVVRLLQGRRTWS